MNARCRPALFAVAVTAVAAHAHTPLSSSFTYQGRLENAGQPVSGTANLVFRL